MYCQQGDRKAYGLCGMEVCPLQHLVASLVKELAYVVGDPLVYLLGGVSVRDQEDRMAFALFVTPGYSRDGPELSLADELAFDVNDLSVVQRIHEQYYDQEDDLVYSLQFELADYLESQYFHRQAGLLAHDLADDLYENQDGNQLLSQQSKINMPVTQTLSLSTASTPNELVFALFVQDSFILGYGRFIMVVIFKTTMSIFGT